MFWTILYVVVILYISNGNCKPLCQRNPGGIVPLEAYPGNGKVAGIGEYPWVVVIERNGSIQCAGALILPQVVVTAAHCSSNLNGTERYVIAGVWNISNENPDYPSQRVAIKEIKISPEFGLESGGIVNDISILILDGPVKLNEYINTICLMKTTSITEPCFVTGWGALEFGGNKTQVPKNLTLPILAHDECEQIFVHKLDKNFALSEKQICAGGQNGSDTCYGDGGAPLVCPVSKIDDRFILTGLTSWGIGCNSQFPGVYTRVADFIEWINEIVMAEGFDTADYLI